MTEPDKCIYLLLFLKIYVILAVLSLHCCKRTFSSCGEWGPLFVGAVELLTAVASFMVEHQVGTRASAVVAQGLSCSAARGIFPDQGSNSCPLCRQVDSQSLDH